MNRSVFYGALRKSLYGGAIPVSAVTTLDGILDAAVESPAPHVAYMMATAYHEVGSDLVPKRESLTYTTAARIRAVWPSRFKTNAAAQPYVRQPKKLANKVYGGRLGNRIGTDDGWIYRGGGLPQTTGRDNFEKVGKLTGIDLVNRPEQIVEPRVAAAALVEAMEAGIYTGKKLRDYKLPAQYYDARAIINGDKSRKEGKSTIGKNVAEYAVAFEAALRAADYGQIAKIPPAPTPKPPVFKVDKTVIESVQQRLKDLGYSEVGGVDGRIGNMTEAAILAFRNENGLPAIPTIDEELITALVTASPRKLEPARTEAPPSVVREKVPEVKSNWLVKIGAYIVGIPSALIGVADGVLGQIGAATGYIQPIKDAVGEVPGWVWFAAIGGGAFVLWRVASRGENKGVDAFRNGERR